MVCRLIDRWAHRHDHAGVVMHHASCIMHHASRACERKIEQSSLGLNMSRGAAAPQHAAPSTTSVEP